MIYWHGNNHLSQLAGMQRGFGLKRSVARGVTAALATSFPHCSCHHHLSKIPLLYYPLHRKSGLSWHWSRAQAYRGNPFPPAHGRSHSGCRVRHRSYGLAPRFRAKHAFLPELFRGIIQPLIWHATSTHSLKVIPPSHSALLAPVLSSPLDRFLPSRPCCMAWL